MTLLAGKVYARLCFLVEVVKLVVGKCAGVPKNGSG